MFEGLTLMQLKLLVGLLTAFLFMYTVVSYIYIDPKTGERRTATENVAKGSLYLVMTIILGLIVYNAGSDTA